eukprot:COSAG02_NODE_33837_length_493_cov_1.401015_1_plen_91_part_10
MDLSHKIVKLDARQTHEVLPFKGIRISVIWYKRYDRTMDAIAPITTDIVQMFPFIAEPVSSIFLETGWAAISSSGESLTETCAMRTARRVI